ncbi:hypothetical protein [Streptomyces sp. 1331.2]|uniref:hypothetical protein n=1 Tax=Streptomyces sp. 1331.2 TaxID=1938835 RepID=UPI000BD5E3A0|nr:hypothetical protein [Streptomyces sp. 1331.2]SOB84234.1 hypothetical protein SAMN06272789_4479 [Streptomyces sp. 1331.2]
MTTTRNRNLIPRETAVRRLADVLSDRTEYLVTIPPGVGQALAAGLDLVGHWTAYLDVGAPEVLVTSDLTTFRGTHMLVPTGGVVTIPKTVHHRAVSRLVRQRIPADGSRDVLLITDRSGGPTYWPLLLVDAVDRVDPVLAAQLRAHGTPADS